MSETHRDQLEKSVSLNEPWFSEELPFNFTATGFLGAKRRQMLSNPLLLRNRVGRGRSSSDVIFGSNYRCPWTVANALNGWAGVLDEPQQVVRKNQKDNTDYMSLNRGAVSAAMISSSDNRTFRKHKVRLQQFNSGSGDKKQERPPPKVLKPGTIYGRPLKYDESIEALTTNLYQKQWLLDTLRKDDAKINYTKVRPTRASMLRPKVVESNLQCQPWRNPHYILKARPHLSTFRDEKTVHDAHKVQELESQRREGHTGQDIQRNSPHVDSLPPLKGKCSDHFPPVK